MSLPDVNLDKRSFQDIVDEVKGQIGRKCPEWTDHNVSDPGVTLIELFAQMTEMMIFQLNQVPEKNYIKFLEMIGISLLPPAPARTDLRFRLSRPIENADGAETQGVTLPARDTVAATVRTETQEAIEFTTERDLNMARPRLAHAWAIPAGGSPGDDARDFLAWMAEFDAALAKRPASEQAKWQEEAEKFAVFSKAKNRISSGDAFYVGFENDLSGNIVQLEFRCSPGAATRLNPEFPLQQWEFWNAKEAEWQRLTPILDSTYGLSNNPGNQRPVQERGVVELPFPAALTAREVNGLSAYWVRCVYRPDLKERAPKGVIVEDYDASPEIRSLSCRVVGGTVTASHCANVGFKELGRSDGAPGQSFFLGHAPVLPLREGETILVGEQGVPRSEMDVWMQQEDFSRSGPSDRHFVLDNFSGQILFGPAIPDQEGRKPRQYGAIPPKGTTVCVSGYRHGGGTAGNVALGQVGILKSSFPYIASVVNPEPATGGREQESLAAAKMRGRSMLRMRDRVVTAEDFEFQAEDVPGVGRARCVRPKPLHAGGGSGAALSQTLSEIWMPGTVRVLIVPQVSENVSAPRPTDLRVPNHVLEAVYANLNERRLLTTVLDVGEPDYVYVSTDIRLIAAPNADPEAVRRGVQRQLERFIHPLTGGPRGTGWPFGMPLSLADVYAQVQAASGVAFLREARLYRSAVKNREDRILDSERLVSNRDGVPIAPNQLLCSREHRIHVVPMDRVGEEEGAGEGR